MILSVLTVTPMTVTASQNLLNPNTGAQWYQAVNKDGLPWNYFHNKVQEHITDVTNSGTVFSRAKIPIREHWCKLRSLIRGLPSLWGTNLVLFL